MNQNYQINSIFTLLKPMLYIFLAVFISVLFLVIFKIFPKYGVNTLVAIIFNYFIAAVTGLIFLEAPFSFAEIVNAPWIKIAVPLGALFVGVFYLISLTAQRIGIAAASVANKMSMVMPVLFALTYLQEQVTVLKICGLLLALISLYLSTKADNTNTQLKKLIWLPVLVFVGSGLIDITINYVNYFCLPAKHHSALFTLSSFFCAFCFGVILIILLVLTKKIKPNVLFEPKNIIGAIVLGIPNYFSIYFIFKALETNVLKSVQLFPVLNLSNVVLAAVVSWLVFREKLSPINIAGICLAVISIILIAL